MKYWKKLHRECAGFYYADSDYTNDVLRIWKIDRNLWGWTYNKRMTHGTFQSLREAREHFGI